LIVLNYIIIIK